MITMLCLDSKTEERILRFTRVQAPITLCLDSKTEERILPTSSSPVSGLLCLDSKTEERILSPLEHSEHESFALIQKLRSASLRS